MSEEYDPILLKILADYSEASRSTADYVKKIENAAKLLKVSFQEVKKAFIDAFPDDAPVINKAVKILETGTQNARAFTLEVEKLAAAFEKVKFAQAQAKIRGGGLFTEQNFLDDIASKAAREKSRMFSDDFDARFVRAKQAVHGLNSEFD